MGLKLQTFDDIVTAIMEGIGVQTADTTAKNKIKRMVNMYYLDEVVAFKRWWWLEKNTQIVHNAFYGTGNVAVTQGSPTVTMDTAPAAALGSFAGHRFAIDSDTPVYYVDSHTAGSTTMTLTLDYQEDDNAEVGFKVWRDRFDLPVDAKETIDIWHDKKSRPMEAIGSQLFRQLEAADNKIQDAPSHYSTYDFVDPSSGDAESDDDRYRTVRIYPSITDQAITLNVDYTQKVAEMTDDLDEPLMPIEDRIVLYYGAGAQAWSVISRNEDMHDRWRMKAELKLIRMANEREDGMDTPALKPRSRYVNAIRRSGLRAWRRRIWRSM